MNKKGNPKHGMYGTPTYQCWCGIKNRCNNKNEPGYKNYGGRGIKVCDRWSYFWAFYEDMGKRPDGRIARRRIEIRGATKPIKGNQSLSGQKN